MDRILLVVFMVLLLIVCCGFCIIFYFFKPKCSCCVHRRVVGIFSYSSPEDYHWITQGLNSPTFRSSVKSTFPLVITNNNKMEFRRAVEDCDFAILYHTKNRGRLNLTNVTDSIYDYELRHMSKSKGRMNVLVVIDDLEKNDYEEKHRILQDQTDIAEYARDLILVSSKDKMYQRGINNKLQHIGDLMSDESWSVDQCCDYHLGSMKDRVWKTVRNIYRQRPGEGLDTPLLV